MTFVGGDSDHLTVFYFNIKELFTVLGCSQTKSESLNRQKQPLRRLAQEGECTSVGAGSPWPVAMIGAAWGQKENLHGRS